MKKSVMLCALAWAAAMQVPGAAFGSGGIPDQGSFIGYQAYGDKNISWTATVGTKFDLAQLGDFTLAFNGRIETVSERGVNFNEGAGLTDINYRLEPRIYWKDALYLSLNHWSHHKVDAPGGVPNLNLVTVGVERELERLKINGGVNYKLSNSDAAYSKVVFLNMEEPLFQRGKYVVYASQAIEAFPSVIGKAEVGLRMETPSRKYLGAVDIVAGWHFGPKKFISSQEGLVPSGPYAGFSLNYF
jgi:hypothetical protein